MTTHKSIASVALEGGVFKYIAVDKILEAEAGITKNEPDQLAIQQAIEKAVYAMAMEAAEFKYVVFCRQDGAGQADQGLPGRAADCDRNGEPWRARCVAIAGKQGCRSGHR